GQAYHYRDRFDCDVLAGDQKRYGQQIVVAGVRVDDDRSLRDQARGQTGDAQSATNHGCPFSQDLTMLATSAGLPTCATSNPAARALATPAVESSTTRGRTAPSRAAANRYGSGAGLWRCTSSPNTS